MGGLHSAWLTSKPTLKPYPAKAAGNRRSSKIPRIFPLFFPFVPLFLFFPVSFIFFLLLFFSTHSFRFCFSFLTFLFFSFFASWFFRFKILFLFFPFCFVFFKFKYPELAFQENIILAQEKAPSQTSAISLVWWAADRSTQITGLRKWPIEHTPSVYKLF